MRYLEWIIWTLLAIYTAIMFIAWLIKKPTYKSGCYYDSGEVVTLHSIPKQTFASAVILTAFVFLDFSKLHLLWIYPVVNFYIAVKISKWVLKKDEGRLNKEADK